jgi:hypothetical protein
MWIAIRVMEVWHILRGLHSLALNWNDEKTRKKHTNNEHSIAVELCASIRYGRHVTNALPQSTCAFDLRSRDPILADLVLSRGTQYTGGSYTPGSRKSFVVGRVSAQKGKKKGQQTSTSCHESIGSVQATRDYAKICLSWYSKRSNDFF